MTRIKNWLLHNSLLKLASLASAFIVWLIVVNYSNPQISSTASVSYDVLNENAISTSGQIYTLSTNELKVTYKVRSKLRSKVTSDAFSAYINLEDYSVTGAVPVYLEIDSSVSDLITDVSVEPEVIHVYTEKIQQKKFAVHPVIEGDVAEGYQEGELQLSPEYIYVKGPVSVMGQISDVGVTVDIENASSDLEGTSTVFFMDANGNPLNGIEESLSFAGDISYTLPVYRIKTLTVNAFTGGAPASGYMVDSVETSPTFISVYGPEETLNQYSYILIPGNALSVAGARENRTFNISTSDYIPEGLTLATQTPEITVYVKIRSIYEDSNNSKTTEETREVNESQPETALESASAGAETASPEAQTEPELSGKSEPESEVTESVSQNS